jgi:TDG/mug DNA glycosylase family protein
MASAVDQLSPSSIRESASDGAQPPRNTLPYLIDERVRPLFVGVNRRRRTVSVQGRFPYRGNRLNPALLAAGIVERLIDASYGLGAADREHLLGRGIGITNLVARATSTISELSSREIVAGTSRLKQLADRIHPRVVAIRGMTAYRIAFGGPAAHIGGQDSGPGLSELWVVLNPSGRNRHGQLTELAIAYRQVTLVAGIEILSTDPTTASASSDPTDRSSEAGEAQS